MLFKQKKCQSCSSYYDVVEEECPHCHARDENFAQYGVNTKIAWLAPWQEIILFLVGFADIGMLIFELLFSLIFKNVSDSTKHYFLIIFFTYLLMLICLVLLLVPSFRKFLKNYKCSTDYLYGIGYAVTLFTISTVVSLLFNLIPHQNIAENQSNAQLLLEAYPLGSIIMLGFFGPICEELTYRVGLFSFLRRINKFVAYAVTIVVFACIHINFTSEDIVSELVSLPTYITGAVILCTAYEHKGPACSMTAHILYNLFTILLMSI